MRRVVYSSLFILAAAASAQASDLCKPYDQSQWMSKDEIKSKVVAMGYDVRKLGTEDGCYEVKGFKDGKRVEAYFDPVTAELVLTK